MHNTCGLQFRVLMSQQHPSLPLACQLINMQAPLCMLISIGDGVRQIISIQRTPFCVMPIVIVTGILFIDFYTPCLCCEAKRGVLGNVWSWMVGLAPKWVRLDHKLDKSGTFSDQISVHLAHRAKCTEI